MIFSQKEARRALENGEFVPYFQPLITLRTGQLAGFEILARWKHPKLGIVVPDQFIYAAERDGWIGALMEKLLRASFESAHIIPASLTLAVNVSPVQFRDLSLAKNIKAIARDTGFELDRLVIEITESALTDNLDHARTITEELKRFGCRIALDDFGTGYSSLLHLQSLRFDDLKVDRSFVSSMKEKRDCRKIVAAVIGLGQSLGLTTVAEGVETKEQAEMLLWMGCDLGQGWLFGKPMPAEALAEAIAVPRHLISTGVSSESIKVGAANSDTLPSQRLAQLQAVYDGSPVGLAFLDRNGCYLNLNQRLADMNGFTVAEHLGKSVAQMLPDLYPQLAPYMLSALQGEIIPGVEIQKHDSTTNSVKTMLLSYQPAFDEVNEVVGISVSLIDITDRKCVDETLLESRRREIELLKTQAQLKAVVAAVPLGIIITDAADGSPNMANPEAMRILGETPTAVQDIESDGAWIAADADGKLVEVTETPLSRALLLGESTAPEDILFTRSDGTETWVSLSGGPIMGLNDEIVGGVVVIQDIDSAKLERQRLLGMAEAMVKELEPEL